MHSRDTDDREPIPAQDLRWLLSEHPLVELINIETAGARLARLLIHSPLGQTTLQDYAEQRAKIETWMLREPNCGRRSVLELRDTLAARAQRQLLDAGIALAAAETAVAAMFGTLPAAAAEQDGPPPGCELQTFLVWQMAQLRPRSAEVVARRFGLAGHQPQTLAEIGEDFAITRERVRQIEAKALRQMRGVCRRFPIQSYLDAARPAVLASVFENAIGISEAAAEKALRLLDGHVVLALELAGTRPRDWLATMAGELGRGWLAPTADASVIGALAEALRSAFSEAPFPRAASEVFAGHDESMARAAAELILEWHIALDYVFARRPGPRALRTAALHAIASQLTGPIDVAALLHRYREAVPSDQCRDRDLVIVMEAAAHLFLETQEASWIALGTGSALSSALPSVDDSATPEDEDEDEGTIAAALERELAGCGPSRLGDLISRALDILPPGRSANSVGPTLLLNPSRFVRVLPGVYALPHQVLDDPALLRAEKLDYLLNPQQARLYALARQAGEEWGSFPLWTIGAEMRMCRWARAHAEPELYRSLLSIAAIKDWLTDELDRATWLELQARHGRFELGFAPRAVAGRPSLDRILAAALQLRNDSRLGWVMANRILGYRPDSHFAHALLGGLVRAGIAEAPTGEFAWQRPHQPGLKLHEWIAQLGAALHFKGVLDWTVSPGPDCWAAFSLSEEAPVDLTSSDAEELDDYESLMAEHRRIVQARRLEAQLDWLED
jgi:hypothetical protein